MFVDCNRRTIFEFYLQQIELKYVNPNLPLHSLKERGQCILADFNLSFKKPVKGRKTVKKCYQVKGRSRRGTCRKRPPQTEEGPAQKNKL